MSVQQRFGSRWNNAIQLLWARRRFVFALTVLVGLVGVLFSVAQKPIYESTATLRIDVPPNAIGPSSPMSGYMRPEIEALRSRQLAGAVIQDLQLLVYPEFNADAQISVNPLRVLQKMSPDQEVEFTSIEAANELVQDPAMPAGIDRFLDRVSAVPLGDSGIIKLSFRAQDATLAANVANALAQQFITERLKNKLDTLEDASQFAREQYILSRDELIDSERAESFYRETFDPEEGERLSLLEQSLIEVESRLTLLRNERQSALSLLEQIRSWALEAANLEQVAFELGVGRLEELAAQRRELVALETLTPMQISALNELNDAIRAEVDQVVVRLERSVSQASEDILVAETDLSTLKLASSTQHRRLLQLKDLQREAAVNRLRFEAAEDRLRQASPTLDSLKSDAFVISEASESAVALYPDRTARVVRFLSAGFALSLLLLLIQQLRNPGLLGPEQVHSVLGELTLGVIPDVPGSEEILDLVTQAPDSPFAQSIKALRLTLDLADIDKRPRMVQLASTTIREGRASLSRALAVNEARQGAKVLLICDVTRHGVKEGLKERAGVTGLILSEGDDVSEFIGRDENLGLDVLDLGVSDFARPEIVFSSKRMSALITEIRERYDFVVIDTPSQMGLSATVALGKLVDQTLLVARWAKTPKKLVATTLRNIKVSDVNVAGVVLQRVNMKRYGDIGFSDFGYLYQHQP